MVDRSGMGSKALMRSAQKANSSWALVPVMDVAKIRCCWIACAIRPGLVRRKAYSFSLTPDSMADKSKMGMSCLRYAGMARFVHENALPELGWWLRFAGRAFMDSAEN